MIRNAKVPNVYMDIKKNQQTNAQVKINTLDKRTSVERFQKRKKTFDQLHYLNLNSDDVVM